MLKPTLSTNVANVMESGYLTAQRSLGIPSGPYLDMKYKGAQPDQYIVKPHHRAVRALPESGPGPIRYVTLATGMMRTSPSPAI